MKQLFVYGTLLDPQIQINVFSRQIKGFSDNLIGYRKIYRKFYDGIYPDLLEDKESIVKGMVLQVSDEDLKKSDIYEGNEYERLKVKLESGILAEVYRGRRNNDNDFLRL